MDSIFNWIRTLVEDKSELYNETCQLSESEFASQYPRWVNKRNDYFWKKAKEVMTLSEITTHQSSSSSDPNFSVDPYSILGIVKLIQMDKTAVIAGYPFLFELTEKFNILSYLFVFTDYKKLSNFDELLFDVLNGIDYAERSPATLNWVHVKVQQRLRKLQGGKLFDFLYRIRFLCSLSNRVFKKQYPELSGLRVTLYRYIASFSIIFEQRAFDNLLKGGSNKDNSPPPTYIGTLEQQKRMNLFQIGYNAVSEQEKIIFQATIELDHKKFSNQYFNLSEKRNWFLKSEFFKLQQREYDTAKEVTLETLLKEVCHTSRYESNEIIDRLFETIVFFSRYKQSAYFILDQHSKDMCFLPDDGFKSKYSYLKSERKELFKKFRRCINGNCKECHLEHSSLSATTCVCCLENETFEQDFPGMNEVREEFYRLILIFEDMPKRSTIFLALIYLRNLCLENILTIVVLAAMALCFSCMEIPLDYI